MTASGGKKRKKKGPFLDVDKRYRRRGGNKFERFEKGGSEGNDHYIRMKRKAKIKEGQKEETGFEKGEENYCTGRQRAIFTGTVCGRKKESH